MKNGIHDVGPGYGSLVPRAAAVAATALSVIILLVNPTDAKAPAWEPITTPAEVVGPVHVLVLAIDDSKSMTEGETLSSLAKAAGRHAVAQVEPCTYAILAVFGTDARVLEDRFLCEQEERRLLFDAIERVSMSAQRTDVGALAGLLSHILDTVTEEFVDRGVSVEMQILTDGKPDPAERTFDSILDRPTSRTELGHGLVLFVAELLSLPAVTASPPKQAAPTVQQQPMAAADSPRLGAGAVSAIGAILFAVGVFVARRRARGKAETVLNDTGILSELTRSPIGLQITEWYVSEERERTLAQGPLTVRCTPNVPITIGADEERVLVALRTPEVSARLASITLDGRGDGVVAPLNGAFRFDDERVVRPLVFAADDPHVLAVGATEVHIEPMNTLPEAEDALYRRLTGSPSHETKE